MRGSRRQRRLRRSVSGLCDAPTVFHQQTGQSNHPQAAASLLKHVAPIRCGINVSRLEHGGAKQEGTRSSSEVLPDQAVLERIATYQIWQNERLLSQLGKQLIQVEQRANRLLFRFIREHLVIRIKGRG